MFLLRALAKHTNECKGPGYEIKLIIFKNVGQVSRIIKANIS